MNGSIHRERAASEPQDRSSSVAHSIEVPSEIIRKWQEIVNLLAEIMHVPSASIMRVDPPHIKVFVSSTSKGNPCEPGALDTGPYCETVMNTGRPLLVSDALENEAWKSNPHVKLGMISYLGVPIGWPDGRIFGTICVRDNKRNKYSETYLKLLLHFRDILQADLKSLARLHGELEERDAKIRRLVDANIIGIFVWDVEGRILEANDAFLRLIGYDRQDVVAGRLRWTELTPPEWLDRDERRWLAELKVTGSLQPFEKEYFRKDGSRVPVLIGAATFEEDGNQGVSFVLDLTERKCAGERLRRSESYLAEAQRLSHTGTWVLDARAMRYLYWSDEAYRIWGFDPLQGPPSRENMWQRIHPDDRDRVREEVQEALRQKRDFSSEFRILLPDGTIKYLEAATCHEFSSSGALVEAVSTQIDVTERKRTEEALREREAKIQRLVDSNIIGIFIWDFDGRILEANDEFLRMVGYDREDLLAGSIWWTDLTPPDWRDRNNARIEQQKSSGRFESFEKEFTRKDGSRVPILIGGATFEKGGNQGVAFVLDLTERKRVEAEARESERRYREAQLELAHANRVATMGQLTASITHEVNQPITAAVTYALAARRWLSAEPPNFHEVDDALSLIVKEGNRAGEVVGRIRALIKKAPARKDAVAINDAILEVIALTRAEAANNSVSVRTQLAEGLPRVQGDRVQLQHVLVNLIINAIEAMRDVGEEERELLISTRNEPDGVSVEVRDSGPGFEPETLEHVFAAFYTTKPGGLGMGLSLCRSIIEAHGGRLWASANLPRGASFQFALPAVANTASCCCTREP